MLKKLCIAAVLCLLPIKAGLALDGTNQAFYHDCKNATFDSGAGCSKPFEAFLEAANRNGRVGMFCPPVQQVTLRQYAAIYFRWVENNPKSANMDLMQGINVALGNAFPCYGREL